MWQSGHRDRSRCVRRSMCWVCVYIECLNACRSQVWIFSKKVCVSDVYVLLIQPSARIYYGSDICAVCIYGIVRTSIKWVHRYTAVQEICSYWILVLMLLFVMYLVYCCCNNTFPLFTGLCGGRAVVIDRDMIGGPYDEFMSTWYVSWVLVVKLLRI